MGNPFELFVAVILGAFIGVLFMVMVNFRRRRGDGSMDYPRHGQGG